MHFVASPRLVLKHLDLKWSLTLRVIAAALFCFFIAATLTVLGACRDVHQANEHLATIVARQLQLQIFRIDSDTNGVTAFPDWDPVSAIVQSPGQCIEYFNPNDTIVRSSCIGPNRERATLPVWFSTLAAPLLSGRTNAVRLIPCHGRTCGTLRVTTPDAIILTAIWNEISPLLALTATMVAAICVLQYLAIGRALRPTKQILAGLDRLARGDLSCRLPCFRLIELQRISEVFNTLAASLDHTRRERTALAARLVDGQEQERRRLARELHDELAQTLSAMGALAAAIHTTAAAICPALLPEAEELTEASLATMKSLRTTLHTLRPPEIDDLGLAASLAALVRDHERYTAGALHVSLEIAANLHNLSPTAATHVYRIVQEGLTNIARHANASRARVALTFRSDPDNDPLGPPWLVLTIEDDGAGPAQIPIPAEESGLGLIGMGERVMALGGELDIARLTPRGFRLQAAFPLTTCPAEPAS